MIHGCGLASSAACRQNAIVFVEVDKNTGKLITGEKPDDVDDDHDHDIVGFL